ncbi:unnamed protein product [Darwinula stevensoni]|uniref:Major facilitator superfamily (MFS) profile domain-containing protein n=1 Tax=Darwinula stevensoni TaxID=69355 RepID=A0A7R8ZZB9_9CRUS|nr:unnamed protein product [Darwinula stevensoni]CAG0878578.1 unnamed protein product [Darwinula stevensoni]
MNRWGRKTTLLICGAIKLCLGLATAFVTNMWMFIMLHFAVAMAASGMYTASFVLVMEVVGCKWRSTIGIAFCFPFSIGYMMLAGFAYFLRDWYNLQIAITIPSVLTASYWWCVTKHSFYSSLNI